MASLNSIINILKEVCEEKSHYLVGEESEDPKDNNRAWIIDVYNCGNEDIILQVSEDDSCLRENAMSVKKVLNSILSLAGDKYDYVIEFGYSKPAKGEWALHIPIVGAYLIDKEEVLIFKAIQ